MRCEGLRIVRKPWDIGPAFSLKKLVATFTPAGYSAVSKLAEYCTHLRNVHKLTTELVPDIPEAILDKSFVKRNGKLIKIKQEIADSKTIGLENKAAIAALTELVGQLAAGRDIDYERIKEGTREVLARETVNVTVDVNPKEEA